MANFHEFPSLINQVYILYTKLTSPSVSVALRQITLPLRGLDLPIVNNDYKYSYYLFVNAKF